MITDFAMILLVKDEQINTNELCFMDVKSSRSQLYRDLSWENEKLLEMGGGGGHSQEIRGNATP